MEFRVKLEIVDSSSVTSCDLMVFHREALSQETLGLQLAESHQLLEALQHQMVKHQIQEHVEQHRCCPECGKQLHSKGQHQKSLYTLFGTMKVSSPRLKRCPCTAPTQKTFSPLAEVLLDRTTPELWFLESKWAALAAYDLTSRLLKEAFPVGRKLNKVTVRNHTLKLARKCEPLESKERNLLGGASQRALQALPIPNGPLMVGLDGGYVRRPGKQGFFEVITGKSLLQFTRDGQQNLPAMRCFGFVQGCGASSQQRLLQVLQKQGVQPNQTITFMLDGGDSLRQVQLLFAPNAEHILDWFHLTMRFTVLLQVVKGLPGFDAEETDLTPDQLRALFTSIKHYLWHGNTVVALEELDSLLLDLEGLEKPAKSVQRLLSLVQELHTYVSRNEGFIVNYGERHRHGEEISSAFVESTVNWVISKRFCKKQQMGWTVLGAHLLRVGNDSRENVFFRANFSSRTHFFP